MKILISRNGENIVTATNLDDIQDRGEIAHIIVELAIIKNNLLKIWDEYENR